jgi:hypothetical protein
MWPCTVQFHLAVTRSIAVSSESARKFHTVNYLHVETNKTNSVALSPQANYIDWATAAGQRTLLPTFADRGVWRGQCGGTTAVNLGFLDLSRYFFFLVSPHLSSRGWVDPVPDPLLLRKSGSAGNRTRHLWVCSHELWPLDDRGGPAACIYSLHKVTLQVWSSVSWKIPITMKCLLQPGIASSLARYRLRAQCYFQFRHQLSPRRNGQ